ncbi:putative esterase of the alpha-beta hydrolase superfamily [Owenweeksia hongkongensis DSM 17368]|uniref:Putative esterase of the alpha-beta hydrolase superfamily n=1 Tax=Owenweeksia hongkongensis (strain DSM 17368 / CIP 108786 / JCM 12287 / NRRL B-23963 / UST20020801) TaxID=926562 RepID=G8R3P2_OWEHD|nr:patatin-like phospholipase family protein [Owenweeksia hongkongensis]AEV34129.1 putative esterase of the alpha-beta hydrolase superfamily [Owenweeksia hongkongensis DSM 17368]
MAKVRLVLGSGGARGIAHIGVIEELINDGHEIVEVVGCSMGAVVGGIFCAGHLQPYKEWLLTLTRSSVFSLTDFTFTRQGFVKGEKVFSTILDMTGPLNIEDLPIPFTAVSTDIGTMTEVHINKGNLFSALRASIAIPGIFTPVIEGKNMLVDGGVLNPLPIDLVSKNEGDLVVAVNINSKDSSPIKSSPKPQDETQKNWIPISWPFHKKDQENHPPNYSLIDLLQTSYDHTQDRLTEMIIKHYKPDLVVNIPRSSCATFEFYRAKEMIEFGKKAYHDAHKTLAKQKLI